MNNETPSEHTQLSTARASVAAKDLELWRGERCLFDNFSFALSSPVLHVRGPNGSGKTTLLKVLCGLTRTERGRVTWRHDDQDVSTDEIRGFIAYSGHQEALNPTLTVAENLAWGAGLYRTTSVEEMGALCRQHGLDSLLPLLAGSLSAGQKRRIALLRSVLSAVPIWVWDEPYANLDDQGIDWVNTLIEEHVTNGGCLILSAHQKPRLAADLVQTLELG